MKNCTGFTVMNYSRILLLITSLHITPCHSSKLRPITPPDSSKLRQLTQPDSSKLRPVTLSDSSKLRPVTLSDSSKLRPVTLSDSSKLRPVTLSDSSKLRPITTSHNSKLLPFTSSKLHSVTPDPLSRVSLFSDQLQSKPFLAPDSVIKTFARSVANGNEREDYKKFQIHQLNTSLSFLAAHLPGINIVGSPDYLYLTGRSAEGSSQHVSNTSQARPSQSCSAGPCAESKPGADVERSSEVMSGGEITSDEAERGVRTRRSVMIMPYRVLPARHRSEPRAYNRNNVNIARDSVIRPIIGKRSVRNGLKYLGLGKRSVGLSYAGRYLSGLRRLKRSAPIESLQSISGNYILTPDQYEEIDKRSGIKFVGLGKRPSALKYVGLGKRASALKYVGLGKRANTKRASALKYVGLGKRSRYEHEDEIDNRTSDLKLVDERETGGKRSSGLKLMGLGKRVDENDQISGYNKYNMEEKRAAGLKFMGLGKREEKKSSGLKFMGLGKREEIKKASGLKFVGLGKRKEQNLM